MPVFELSDEIVFPHPSLAEDDGLLAIGGDLLPERILTAYINGIFPWFNENDPILWWSPNPRCVLFPDRLKISKSLKAVLRNGLFNVKYDTAFESVVQKCATAKRSGEGGTWISADIKKSYTKLFDLGFAHSVEAYFNGSLVGGLYGVAIGKVFFGESMFFEKTDASKVAFCFLIEKLKEMDFVIVDCQITNNHLLSIGAEEISRDNFLDILKEHTLPFCNKTWQSNI